MKEPYFKETSPDQIIHEIAMPLIAVGHRHGQVEEYVAGTAFVIAHSYALTAYHVIEDLVGRYEGHAHHAGALDVRFELLTLLSLDGNTRQLPMKALRIWRTAPLDMAILALGVPQDWPTDYRWKVPVLQLLPPKPGDEIVAFGFANTTVIAREGEPSEVLLHPSTAMGHVIEVHHNARDSYRLNFPCFRTDARFDGGMSGGPVLNNRTGQICGVVCSSLPPNADDESHVSYASTLWPIVGTPLDDPTKPVGDSPTTRLIRLMETGLINADRAAVCVAEQPDGNLRIEPNYRVADWNIS